MLSARAFPSSSRMLYAFSLTISQRWMPSSSGWRHEPLLVLPRHRRLKGGATTVLRWSPINAANSYCLYSACTSVNCLRGCDGLGLGLMIHKDVQHSRGTQAEKPWSSSFLQKPSNSARQAFGGFEWAFRERNSGAATNPRRHKRGMLAAAVQKFSAWAHTLWER